MTFILVVHQPYNGIYVVTTTGSASAVFVLTRATDFDNGSPSGEIPGAFTFVEQGSTQADTGWVCTTNAPITVGTTEIEFSQFSGAGQYTAGDGLALTGTTFSVNVDNSTIVISADSLKVADSATFVTPNIGIAGGTSLTASGNVSANNLSATNDISGIIGTFTGNVSALNFSTTGNISAANISGNLTTATQANITSVGNLTGLTVTGVSDLGPIGNVIISGGTSGYILSTNGSGNLSWVNAASTGIAGSNTQVQFNNSGSYGASANFTFNYLTETLAATVITASGNLTSTAGNLILANGAISVSGNTANIFSTVITDANLGLEANVTIGSTTGNTTARGNLVANNISTAGNLTVSTNATITNLKVNDLYSNRTPINVTMDTIVDSFPVNKYRSAKYTMRVNSDDGHQAVEVLLIHDGANSYVTIYGSLSTTGSDIILLGTAINSGNVQLLATSAIANTTVNLLGTYVAD